MRAYRNPITIGGQKKILLTVNYSGEDEPAVVAGAPVAPDIARLHHIHILDRSYSMSSHINELIDNVQLTQSSIGDDDLISILWFSSAGDFKVLFKGAKKSDDLTKMLDTLRSTRGCTCFSESVAEAEVVIDDLAAICPDVSVTLFTDGDAVVPWGRHEEEKRVMELVEGMSDKLLAFNTVGYGYYYNQEFLRNVSAFTQYGQLTHSTRIDEYVPIFETNVEKVADLVSEAVSITCNGNEAALYTNGSFVKSGVAGFELRAISKRKNQFFFILDVSDDDTTCDTFAIATANEGTIYEIDGLKPAREATVTNFLYAYAYSRYYEGDRASALDALAVLCDKDMIDGHMIAFTYDEVARQTEALRKAALSRKNARSPHSAPANYVPDNDAFCLMDLINILSASDSLYVPYSDLVDGYTRIGKKTTDEASAFTFNAGEVRAKFSDLVPNKEFLNLSVRFAVNGNVAINPKSAARVNLPESVDAAIFRTHTIIKDGALNIKKIEALLDQATYNVIGPYVNFVGVEGDYTRVVIDLDGLPIINRTYVDGSIDIETIYDVVVATTKLEARQKVVKYYLDKYLSAEKSASNAFSELTAAQIEVLTEHGVSNKMIYGGIKNTQKPAGESDSYEARLMNFYLKGFSSLPKVDLVIGGKKGTASQKAIAEAIDFVNANVIPASLPAPSNKEIETALSTELVAVKRLLSGARTKLAALKLAKILTGDWFDGLDTDDKGNYIYKGSDYTMLARADRVTKYF